MLFFFGFEEDGLTRVEVRITNTAASTTTARIRGTSYEHVPLLVRISCSSSVSTMSYNPDAEMLRDERDINIASDLRHNDGRSMGDFTLNNESGYSTYSLNDPSRW